MSTNPSNKPKKRNPNAGQHKQHHRTTPAPPHQPEVPPQNTSIAYTNDQLNLSVLRRYWPDISTVIHVTPYAVLYVFSPTSQTWEKVGIEGTLFVVLHRDFSKSETEEQEERFSVAMLNRRGMDNFCAPLLTPDDLDVTEQYIIINESEDIFGFWIFSEPEPSSTAHARETTAHIIMECARRAQASREKMIEVAADAAEEEDTADYDDEDLTDGPGAPLNRTMSIRDIVDNQRVQDAAFSVHEHRSPQVPSNSSFQTQNSSTQAPKSSLFMKNPDTEFFHSGTTPVKPNRNPPRSTAPDSQTQTHNGNGVAAGTSISVDDLFAKARQGG